MSDWDNSVKKKFLKTVVLATKNLLFVEAEKHSDSQVTL
jgi:hypothetical protein